MENDLSFSPVPSRQLVRRFHGLALILAVITAVIGGIYLAGWLSGFTGHRGAYAAAIKTNASLALLLLGTGLVLLVAPYDGKRPLRMFAWLCAGAATMIGTLTLGENIFGWDLGIDQMLAAEPQGVQDSVRPNRMGVHVSLSLTAAGIALFLLDRRPMGILIAQVLGLGVFLIGLTGVVDFLYHIQPFYAIVNFKDIARPTAAALMLLGLAILFSRPGEGVMKLMTADDSGGRIARRLLPLSVLLPLVLGYLRLIGERLNLYDTATGTGWVILLFMILFSLIAYITGQRLSRVQAAQYDIQQALRESEKRSRSTFENAAVGIAHVDMDGQWLRVNDRLSEITGYSRQELLAGKFQDITHPGDIESDLRGVEALRAGRVDTYSLEKRYFHKDGGLIWVNSTVALQRENHDPAYMIAVIQDISERKGVEEALKKSEERFRKLADAMPQLVWTAEPGGSVDYYNIRRFEYQGINQTGEGNFEWAMVLHPEDVVPTVKSYNEAVRTGGIYQMEHRVRMNDGTYRWHLSRGIPVHDEQGKIIKIYGTATDIHEIKQAQEALRRKEYELKTLVENSPDIIIRFDRDFRYVFVNSTYEQVTGIRRERFAGKTNQDLGMPEEYYVEWKLAAENVLRGGRGADFEFSFPGVFGRRHFWGQVIPEFDRAGEVETMMLIARDITKRKQAEENIRYISFHDHVTGLYNRAYFENETRRIDDKRSLPVSFIIGKINYLKLVNDVFGYREGDRLLAAIADILRRTCRKTDVLARWGGDEFAVILPRTDEETAQGICACIQEAAEKADQTVLPLSIATGTATKHQPDEEIYRELMRAEERMHNDKMAGSEKNRKKVIAFLHARVLERWPDREGHLERTRKLAQAFSKDLDLSPDDIRNLNTFILYHDIGKAAVPAAYLDKQGPLTAAEWETVKRNPEAGFRIARTFSETARISDEILSLRERWDGTGYPRGLKGEEIPLLSRILSIVDSYDIMTHDTPYKPALSREEAIREIRKNAGRQFDPSLSETFISRVA